MAYVDALYEPARLRAIYAAAVQFAVTLGVTIPLQVDAWFTALLAVLAVVVPLVQGELTRRKVVPLAKTVVAPGDNA